VGIWQYRPEARSGIDLDTNFFIGIIAFLGGLFLILGLWQRKIARRASEQAVREIREAEVLGTRKALAQHPQIQPYLCIGCGSCIAACPEDGVLGLVDGISHVIHGSRCIGHGRCAQACPVGAITVGLGEIAARPDIPLLSGTLETSVPGIYVAGELGGIALIRHAIDQGARAMEDIADRLERSGRPGGGTGPPDVLVVGAGPAGISATLKARERGLRCIAIEQDDLGGAVRKYPRRKLTMMQPVDLPLHGRLRKQEYLKEELVEMWEEIVRKFELPIHTGVRLLSLARVENHLEARTSRGVLRSRAVVLALGRRGTPRKLGVPGEETEKVLYQLIDAAGYNGQKLLVVGGGDSAVEAATGLANQAGNLVTLSYRQPAFFRLKERNRRRIEEYSRSGKVRVVFSSEVKAIEPQAVALAIREGPGTGAGESMERRELIPNDFVFVLAGGDPPFPLLRATGIQFGGEDRARSGTRSVA
jgi:dihydropyrimidine dehydrogenase (NAD+) subunit PreT